MRVALLSALMMASAFVVGACDRTSSDTPEGSLGESITTTSSPRVRPTLLTAAQVFRRGDLKSYASRNGVETLTVWEVCGSASSRCRRFWVLSGATPEAVVGDAGVGAIPAITASSDGYVVKAFGRPGFVVRPDGTRLPLREGTAPPRVTGDTVILRPHGHELTAVDPARGTTWELPARPGGISIFDTAVTSGGDVWAIPGVAQGADLELLRLQDGRWHAIPMSDLYRNDTTQQQIASTRRAPNRVAVSATYGHAESPPAMVVVSTDAGRNWHRLIGHGLPFRLGDSMAIAGETLYVATVGGQVWRTVDPGWTRFERVPGLHGVIGLQPAGDRVIGWRWRSSELVSIDHTAQWHVIAFEQRSANE